MKKHDFKEKTFQVSYPIEVILNALLLIILGMVDASLGLWKYLKNDS